MTFNETNIHRLARGIRQCQEVLVVPRRLGGDATDRELADDKRIARRVKHRLEVALGDWPEAIEIGKQVMPDGTGSRLLWSEWWSGWQEAALELREHADNRSQQHSIDRELESIAYIFADHR